MGADSTTKITLVPPAARPSPLRKPAPPNSSSRHSAFTRYVRALEPRGEPGRESFDNLWHALRQALVAELKKRSLWMYPPSWVGVEGWESWETREPCGEQTRSAVDELLADCYVSIFVERLPRLRAQLRTKENIDGLVFLYLRNFVHDRQKQSDPLGYRVYSVLRKAVEDAVAAGELHRLGGDARIRNATLLATSAGADVVDAVGADALQPIVQRWNDELLPGLVTFRGAQHGRLLELLRQRFFELEAHGIRVFRFKDLVDPLKSDVRHRWAALFDHDEGESAIDDNGGLAIAVRWLNAEDRRLEDLDHYSKLVRCVTHRIEHLEVTATTLRYLRTLWTFLQIHVTVAEAESLPSNRQLGARLEIPRERLPSLFRILSQTIGWCRRELSLPRPASARKAS